MQPFIYILTLRSQMTSAVKRDLGFEIRDLNCGKFPKVLKKKVYNSWLTTRQEKPRFKRELTGRGTKMH